MSAVSVTTESAPSAASESVTATNLVATKPKPGVVKSSQPKDFVKHKLANYLVDKILEKYQFGKDGARTLYYYEKGDPALPSSLRGVYVPYGRELCDKYSLEALKLMGIGWKWEPWMPEHMEKRLLVECPKLPDMPDPDYINVRNGMLNWRTMELVPHNPLYSSMVQLPIWYDPKAKCPGWDLFMAEVLENDCQELAWEIPGWLLRPDKSIQSAVVLVGMGANGKSTYLDGIRWMLGDRNYSTASIQYLQQNRFATYNLIGKLANICADLPTREMSDSDVFKALTGDDPIEAEPKFRQRFTFKCYARLVFSANNPPIAKDAGWAYYRRWIIVPFNREFVPGTPGFRTREEIREELFSIEEMSGFFNRALAAMKRLHARKGFSTPPSVTSALQEFMNETNPLHLWIESCIDFANQESHDESKDAILKSYNSYRRKQHLPPVVSSLFWKEFTKATGRQWPEKKLGSRESRYRVVTGLRLVNSLDD